MSTNRAGAYLTPGRLGDVLALIQVLALDEKSHRSKDGLASELQGNPRSTENWRLVAQEHPEFFRVRPDGEHIVSLIARHVSAQEVPLSAEHMSKLLTLAVDLHDREVRRAQVWHVWIPVIVAVTASVFTLFGIWLKSVLGGGS
jgi:hypothetical protein